MAQMEFFFTKNLLIFIDSRYWGEMGDCHREKSRFCPQMYVLGCWEQPWTQEMQSKGWSFHVCCHATSGVISWDVLFWAPHVSLSEVGIPQNESLDRKNMETHMINTVFEGSPFSQKLVFDLGIPKASSWGSFHIRYNPKRRTLDAHCNCKCFITMASFSLSILSIFPGQSFLVLIHTFNFVGNF